MTIRFVTSNEGKVEEAREYLTEEVEQVNYDYTEIQSDDLAEIALAGAREAFEETGGEDPVVVDDAGLFVDALGGFPGPYSSYVEETLGIERVWRLGREEDVRRARFRCVLAYCDGGEFRASPDPIDRDERVAAAAADADADDADDADEEADPLPVKLFEGVVPGTLVAPRGEGGFGYDPIFEHNGATMAEMSTEEKNAISHRGRALAKFAEWYAERTEEGEAGNGA